MCPPLWAPIRADSMGAGGLLARPCPALRALASRQEWTFSSLGPVFFCLFPGSVLVQVTLVIIMAYGVATNL